MNQGAGMSDTDRDFWQQSADFSNNITKRINDSGISDVTTEATFLLYGRIVKSCNSLMILADHAPHDFSFDGAMILRGMYDAMIQCLYILGNPDKREDRASLFLDFFCVEQHRLVKLADTNSSLVARCVRSSPKRPGHEPRLQKEFNRIKGNYTTRKGGLQDKWYKGPLRNLARDVGYEDEYEMLQRYLSPSVHSSVFALKWGDSGISISKLVTDAWLFSLRVLGQVAEAAKVELTNDEKKVIQDASKSVIG